MTYKKITKTIAVIKLLDEETRKRFSFYNQEFLYTLRRRINFKRKKNFKPKFINYRILCNFYLVLRLKDFRRLINTAKKRQGYFIENYITLVECRLYMMVYRTNLISNLFLIRYVIKEGIFTVNNVIKYHYNIFLKWGDILSFSTIDWQNIIKKDLVMRLRNNVIMYPVPNYILVCYAYMFFLFWCKPRPENLVYPEKGIDIHVGNEYYVI